jgi:hypothetical protein
VTPGADLERLALEYETSLSWRLTRPLRAAKRLVRGRGEASEQHRTPTAGHNLDSWLAHYYGERLAEIDRACAEPFARALRPVAEPRRCSLGTAADRGVRALSAPSGAPADDARARLAGAVERTQRTSARESEQGLLRQAARSLPAPRRASLATASVLDFGCGWGRLTRYLARDVTPGRLYGCDPNDGILDVCRASRVPATLAHSDFRPRRLPFDRRFDLAFAFSVFTHLSEAEHERCLRVLHAALEPEGVLIVTIRPPAYLHSCAAMQPLRDTLGSDESAALATPRYLFVPHPAVAMIRSTAARARWTTERP